MPLFLLLIRHYCFTTLARDASAFPAGRTLRTHRCTQAAEACYELAFSLDAGRFEACCYCDFAFPNWGHRVCADWPCLPRRDRRIS